MRTKIFNIVEKASDIDNKSPEFSLLIKMLSNIHDKHSELSNVPAILNEYKNKDITDVNIKTTISKLNAAFNLHLKDITKKEPEILDIDDIKGLYNYIGDSFLITRSTCDNSVSDEVLQQFHKKSYSSLYLECLFQD